MVNLAADSWTKYRIFDLKSRKYSCPKKLFLFFAEILRRRIFVDFKTTYPVLKGL